MAVVIGASIVIVFPEIAVTSRFPLNVARARSPTDQEAIHANGFDPLLCAWPGDHDGIAHGEFDRRVQGNLHGACWNVIAHDLRSGRGLDLAIGFSNDPNQRPAVKTGRPEQGILCAPKHDAARFDDELSRNVEVPRA